MKTNTPFKSKKKDKKFSVYAFDGKTTKLIHFGAKGYSDYTIHKDYDRMKRYEQRHKNNEDWNNVLTAGFWAKWILWNLPDYDLSLKDTIKRFKLKQIEIKK